MTLKEDVKVGDGRRMESIHNSRVHLEWVVKLSHFGEEAVAKNNKKNTKNTKEKGERVIKKLFGQKPTIC